MSKIQASVYRTIQWKDFRRSVIEAHQCRCDRCNKSESDGITFQVHHTRYESSLLQKPCEYPLATFEVLCKGCHAKEHGHIMPTEGWEYIGDDCEDMGEPCFPCEYPGCGYELRYVHTVYHPQWGYLNVGSVHADKLTGTNQATEVEKAAKRKQTMYESFLNDKKWLHTNNRHSRDFVQFPVSITQHNDTYQLSIFIPLQGTYKSLIEAQKAAFDICYNSTPQQFFQQYNIPYDEAVVRKPRSKKNPIIYRNQLTFAINNQTGKIVHIDSVEPDIMCNCVCPGCGQPLKAEVSSKWPEDHHFVHLYGEPCEDFFVQMYRQLALYLIEQNNHILLPSLENTEAELCIPDSKIQIKTIQYPSAPFDAIVTYTDEGIEKQIGIFIDIDHSSIDEQVRHAKSLDIPVLQISLIKQFNSFPPLKRKELQEILLSSVKSYSWLHNPEFDKIAEQTLQEKQSYLNQIEIQIRQDLNKCIIGELDIRTVAKSYESHDRYPKSVKRIFFAIVDDLIQRIIFEPTPNDIQNSEKCNEIVRWYEQRNTIQGINYDLLDILNRHDFIEAAKKTHNHTMERMLMMNDLFGYYFIHNVDYIDENMARCRYNTIRKRIRDRFINCSSIFTKQSPLSPERKVGMELCFLLYLYYGVAHFSWNSAKKAFMFRQITKTDNLPIFAAIGSLWFGHIFNCFQTDEFQSFIQTIATQYPQAAPWVLTYIESTNYYDYCQHNNISYKELESYKDEYYNKWIAGVFYSTLPYYYDSKNNRHELFPKASLPQIYN